MVIPNDREIKRALLGYLAGCPGNRAHAQECYAALEPLFPGLSNDEVTLRYRTSVSKWANSVQFARLHLVNDGLVHKAGEGPMPRRGDWILTSAGVNAGQQDHAGAVTPPVSSVGTAPSEKSQPTPDEGAGILLSWNRGVWDDWPDTYEGTVNRLMSGDRYADRWSVGRRRDVFPGTEAWLLRQGGPYGLIGHGVVTSNTFVDAHFAQEGETSRYVTVEFDVLLNEEDILLRDELEIVLPEIAWRYQFTSGNRVAPAVNARLSKLWQDHIS